MDTIIILVLLAILLICIWSGYKKGIIMGIGGIVAIIVSLYGANLLATAFSYELVPALKPFAGGFIEQQINAEDGVVYRMGWADYDYSVGDMLKSNPGSVEKFCSECYEVIGIDEGSAELMSGEAMKLIDEGGDAVDSVVQVLCERVSFVGCFVLAFLLILIVLTVIGNLPNLSYKIPHLDTVNDIGGAVLGLITGIMFCTLLVWALKFTGKIIGADALSGHWLTRIFLEKNFVTHYLGI